MSRVNRLGLISIGVACGFCSSKYLVLCACIWLNVKQIDCWPMVLARICWTLSIAFDARVLDSEQTGAAASGCSGGSVSVVEP